MASSDAVSSDPTEAARVSAQAIHDLGATFMLDPQTYVVGAELGYEGTGFYFGGRGGVLGDVSAVEVAEAFIFFPLETTTTNWEAAAKIESRDASARRFAEVAHQWARTHLAEGAVDYDRLGALAGKIIAAADGSNAPVFAGWRRLDEPSGSRELALHRINALRELRAARHGDAVKEVGLAPVDAFMVKTPYMAPIFGWATPEGPPSEEHKALWDRAEDLTNEYFGRDLAVLDPAELTEFCDLANAAFAAMS